MRSFEASAAHFRHSQFEFGGQNTPLLLWANIFKIDDVSSCWCRTCLDVRIDERLKINSAIANEVLSLTALCWIDSDVWLQGGGDYEYFVVVDHMWIFWQTSYQSVDTVSWWKAIFTDVNTFDTRCDMTPPFWRVFWYYFGTYNTCSESSTWLFNR